jgi:hypothetical protein
METQTKSQNKSSAITTGIILILIGAAILITQFVELGAWVIVVPGVVMLAAGIVRRSAGWLIPGGIVTGVGLGALLTEAAIFPGLDNEVVILMAIALGFLSIVALTALFAERALLWPFIPGGIMVAIALVMLAGASGLAVLEFIGKYWPVVLILIGGMVIAGAFLKRNGQDAE